jgi:hypothetical protein
MKTIRANKSNSRFAQHTYDTVEKTMAMLYIENKRSLTEHARMLSHTKPEYTKTTHERYTQNPIFDVIIKRVSYNKPLISPPAPTTT